MNEIVLSGKSFLNEEQSMLSLLRCGRSPMLKAFQSQFRRNLTLYSVSAGKESFKVSEEPEAL